MIARALVAFSCVLSIGSVQAGDLVEKISKQYRVAPSAVKAWVNAAREAGKEFGLDPTLILAVIAIESRFNPVAHSKAGAKGLMQVMPRVHGIDAVTLLDPIHNIKIGAGILSKYRKRSKTMDEALQRYNGSTNDAAMTYSGKVRNVYKQLKGVAK